MSHRGTWPPSRLAWLSGPIPLLFHRFPLPPLGTLNHSDSSDALSLKIE